MDTPNDTSYKRCALCREYFPRTNEYFHINNANKDKLAFRCKSCVCSVARDRQRGLIQKKRQRPYIAEAGIEGAIGIPLTKGYLAIIDHDDIELSKSRWHAHVDQNGYISVLGCAGIKGGKDYKLSRIILSKILNRVLDKAEKADHIDGDSLNNRRNNLRLATQTQNNRNAKRRKDNKSGYKGVYFKKSSQKWVAAIRVDSKCIHLGYRNNAEDAYELYKQAAIQYFGEFARLE